MKVPYTPALFLLVGFLVVVFGIYGFFFHSESGNIYPETVELASAVDWEFQDFAEYFRVLAEKKSAAYAFEVLYRAVLPASIDTHLLGHIVGDVLYRQRGIDGIKICTDALRNACSHSVVIGILLEHGEGSLPTIANTCKQAPGGRGAYTMCFHGLGHGVLAYTGYDFEKAVLMCKRVGTAEYRNREYLECVGGASMEMVAGVHDRTAWERQAPKYLKKDDPLYPCTAPFMPEDAKAMCMVYITPRLFEAAGLDLNAMDASLYEDALSECEAIPAFKKELRGACFGGFGKEFIGLASGKDIRDVGSLSENALRHVRAWCDLAHSPHDAASCHAATLGSLFWGGENNPNAAFAYCELSETPDTEDACFAQLRDEVVFYFSGTAGQDDLCDRLPEKFRMSCKKQNAAW